MGWLSCMVYCQPIVTIRIQNIPLEVQSTGVVSYNYFIFSWPPVAMCFLEKNCNEEDKSLKGKKEDRKDLDIGNNHTPTGKGQYWTGKVL